MATSIPKPKPLFSRPLFSRPLFFILDLKLFRVLLQRCHYYYYYYYYYYYLLKNYYYCYYYLIASRIPPGRVIRYCWAVGSKGYEIRQLFGHIWLKQ